jgi:hypothetical protein
MQKPHRVIRPVTRHVGDPCSKYGYDRNGEQFEKDIQAHIDRADFLWNEFVEFMKSHNATPSEFRSMFTRYYEEYLKG